MWSLLTWSVGAYRRDLPLKLYDAPFFVHWVQAALPKPGAEVLMLQVPRMSDQVILHIPVRNGYIDTRGWLQPDCDAGVKAFKQAYSKATEDESPELVWATGHVDNCSVGILLAVLLTNVLGAPFTLWQAWRSIACSIVQQIANAFEGNIDSVLRVDVPARDLMLKTPTGTNKRCQRIDNTAVSAPAWDGSRFPRGGPQGRGDFLHGMDEGSRGPAGILPRGSGRLGRAPGGLP